MKHPYAGEHYVSGETVTPGKFECTECGHRLEIEAPRITNLPVCPGCQNDTWAPARGLLRRWPSLPRAASALRLGSKVSIRQGGCPWGAV